MEHTSRRARVAGEIRAELARQGRTAKDLAEHMRIDRKTLRRRLVNPTSFDIEEIESAANFLNIRLSVLIERTEA